VDRLVKVSYTERVDEKERLKKVTKILSDGVYSYLKMNGLLREKPERTERIKELVDRAKEIGTQIEEEIEGDVKNF